MEFLTASVTMRVPGLPGGQPYILNLHIDPQVVPLQQITPPITPREASDANNEFVAGFTAPQVSDQASQPQGVAGGPFQGGNFDGHRIQNLVKLGETLSPYVLAILAMFGVKLPPLPFPPPNPPAPAPAA